MSKYLKWKAQRKNPIGQKFGRLTVIAYSPAATCHRSGWLCICICGNLGVVGKGDLTNGNTKSCGCLRRDRLIARSTTHGKSHMFEYRSWNAMKNRCYNPQNKSYKNYGERGIAVCDKWRDSFESFLFDMGLRPKGLTLDRINNDGNYSPDNCRWTDWSTQNRNKRQYRKRKKTL